MRSRQDQSLRTLCCIVSFFPALLCIFYTLLYSVDQIPGKYTVGSFCLSCLIPAAGVDPDSQRCTVEYLHSLGEQPGYHTGQHIAGTRLRHCAVSGKIDKLMISPAG